MKRNYILFFVLFFAVKIFSENIDITAGFGLTAYGLPTVNINNLKESSGVVQSDKDSVSLFFGAAGTIPFTFCYHFSNNWGIGFSSEAGYNFMAGRNVYLKNAPSDYDPVDYTYMFHAFLGNLNFMIKSPRIKNSSLLIELGIILRPTFWFAYTKAGNNDNKYNTISLYIGNERKDYKTLLFLGPAFFVGGEVLLGKNASITLGARLSTEFAKYDIDYTINNINYKPNEFYIIINMAFELRIGYYHQFNLKRSDYGSQKFGN
ncbi:MAG: hypothetical protein A2086_15265 [Spirochaetes bacterium GWD1_27_9]|nr:MAG: hypothetical protein A2Z98_05925 [Spirochaetes bacterium GWB1_27_13]OHD25188.1 MAG: hypothetical protein A2Y34_15005 [Spirochaetes bacterium GWC1_27_15]OHD31256.1 MAG: hypothetical protein A2086_15265 [Spirochaetes bacterium GWD1_27_9]